MLEAKHIVKSFQIHPFWVCTWRMILIRWIHNNQWNITTSLSVCETNKTVIAVQQGTALGYSRSTWTAINPSGCYQRIPLPWCNSSFTRLATSIVHGYSVPGILCSHPQGLPSANFKLLIFGRKLLHRKINIAVHISTISFVPPELKLKSLHNSLNSMGDKLFTQKLAHGHVRLSVTISKSFVWVERG